MCTLSQDGQTLNLDDMLIMVLYSLYWVFWGEFKKKMSKGKIVVTDVQASTAACI
jgi:hypothetical protein